MKMLVYVAALLAMPIGVAHAVTPPPLREGLWQMHLQDTASPGNKTTDSTTEICRNHAYDQHVQSIANNVKMGCTKINESADGSTYTVEMRCVVGPTTIQSKSVATFQGDTAAHSETHSTFTPAFGGETGDVMIQDSKYVGSCPAGMQPGDRMSANGTIIHSGRH
ncbi:DUF3617 family protein [Dyella sp. S184]|jgi:hypothetical protein|uniref:DUF3617 domain-containing protein n=1 Tax=Dyella sp. S184 TaxID=1641862 RepID=UPI00131C05A1|nr:DUF3617 family protein [Dyella sp. S184]